MSVQAPRPLARALARIQHLDRRMARQQGPYDARTRSRRRPSNRWLRTRARLRKQYARAANLRKDVLHKTTTSLAQRHDVIVVEALNVSALMTGSAARKRGLNRAIADVRMAEIRRMLTYKTEWYGSSLVTADRWFPSSRLCSACGTRKSSLLLAETEFYCVRCGLRVDRDRNAAINLACLGVRSVRSPDPAGSGPVAGRGAESESKGVTTPLAAGDETSTLLENR